MGEETFLKRTDVYRLLDLVTCNLHIYVSLDPVEIISTPRVFACAYISTHHVDSTCEIPVAYAATQGRLHRADRSRSRRTSTEKEDFQCRLLFLD